MRARPSDYELVIPHTLPAVLSLLAQEPGLWLPIAGGTDVMVQYAAGKLVRRKLVSIWNLPELRRIPRVHAAIACGSLDRGNREPKSRYDRRKYRKCLACGRFAPCASGLRSGTAPRIGAGRTSCTLHRVSYRLPEDADCARRADSRHLPEEAISRVLCACAQGRSTQCSGDRKGVPGRAGSSRGWCCRGYSSRDGKRRAGSPSFDRHRANRKGKSDRLMACPIGENDRNRGGPAD